MMKIHSSAIINPGSEIGDNVEIGPFTIVEEDVVIAEGCRIGSHALISSGTRLGKECIIHHGAVLGTLPQDLKFKEEKTTLEIGERTTVREYATLNRGTTDHWKTVIGSNCLLMAYSHVAHDCTIGDNVVIANSVNMAGHVTIEDFVGIGGLVPIHQFVKIGRHAFIAGACKVPKDIPPYILALGEPIRYGGLNIIGLRRRGFTPPVLTLIKKAYRFVFQSKLLLQEALKKIEDELEPIQEIQHILTFFRSCERGVIRKT
jgi:UDP-N-acetylglucosamine acyltransferase